MVDITKRAGARLRQAGFIKTRFIVGMEETEEVSLRLAAAILSDPAARRYVAAMGYHSYPYGEGYSSTSFILRTSGAGSPDRARVAVRYRLRDLGKQYNVKVWMTENSNGGAPLSYDTFRARAIQIHDEFLYADASAYFGENAIWDLTSQRSHFRNSSLYENEGSIVLVNEDTGAVDITGIGYAIGHYARWVKPGAVRVEASSSNPLVQVSAFRDEEREMVGFVLINNAASTSAVDISLAGLRVTGNLTGEQSAPSSYWKRLAAFAPSSATTFTITLPPTSVTSVGGRLQSAA
jgi:O-glycosyl hydrolase